jgi:hypothetical protein
MSRERFAQSSAAYALAGISLLIPSGALAQTDKSPSISPPSVTEPVAPKAAASPDTKSPPPEWKPGQPVKVMPDLKKSVAPAGGREPAKRKRADKSTSDCPVHDKDSTKRQQPSLNTRPPQAQ